MNTIWKLAKQMLRWSVRGVSLASALAVLFLGGYWLGWKSQGQGQRSAESVRPTTSAASSDQDQATPNRTPNTAPAQDAVEVVQETAEARVARLAKWLETGRDPRTANARVTAEIAMMSLSEAWAALEQLHHAPDTKTAAELRSKLLLRWAAFDPAGAFEYWRGGIKSLRWPESLNYQFLGRWAKVDPTGALKGWKTLVAENGLPEHEQGFPLRGIIAAMARQDFHLAAEQARHIQGDNRKEALRGLAELALQAEHREKLLHELSAWPPGEERDQVLTAAAANWAQAGDLDQVMSWLSASGVEEATRFNIVHEIGMRRFHDHYREGADWLLAQARTPEQRSRAMANLVINWMQYDLVQAGEWLVAQGLDDSAGRAMQIYADKLTADFPEEALAWALSIPNHARRQDALTRVEKRLRERHPQRAEELWQRWVGAHNSARQ